MIINTIIIIIAVAVLALIINKAESYYKSNKLESISFKESMDLVELPIITFYNKDKKLNFLLDTGSDLSHINKSLLPALSYKEIDDTTHITSIGGTQQSLGCCEMEIYYKKQKFTDKFFVNDLDEAFGVIKNETGVQIHGILGSRFFAKYKYILNFDTLQAYNKK